MTHEEFIHRVLQIAAKRLNDEVARTRLLAIKLTYGSGRPGVRGITFYDAWEDSERRAFVEICASGEESFVQLAGTTIHELAHCLAGSGAGHDSTWKKAARSLGLRRAQAAGQQYVPENFDPTLRSQIEALAEPTDGRPTFFTISGQLLTPRPCTLGIGTRGGKSRGPGSGSRLRLFVCGCVPPVLIRVSRDEDNFRVKCLVCDSLFKRKKPIDNGMTVGAWPLQQAPAPTAAVKN